MNEWGRRSSEDGADDAKIEEGKTHESYCRVEKVLQSRWCWLVNKECSSPHD